MNEENWYPTEEEYTPNLSQDDWLKLLQDEKIFDYNSMCLMRRLKDIGGQATCKQLAEKYGKTPSAYIAYEKALAKRILDNSNCNVPKNVSLFSILFFGKFDSDNIHYIWKLRPELSAALDEIDLTKYELYEEKEVDFIRFRKELECRLKNSDSKFIINNKGKDFFWLSDGIIGILDCHYEFISYENSSIFYLEIHFENKKTAELFQKLINDDNCSKRASLVSIAWEEFSNALRLNKNFDLNEDSVVEKAFDELKKLDDAIGDELRKILNKKEIKMEQEKIIESYKNLLEANRNLILHGAPGTGKTHTAKDIAALMICGKSYAEVEKDEVLNKQFNEQTEFVQFHPSYDYSDFVEGLRPKNDDNGNVGFERKDGVFKQFCKRALKANFSDGVDNFDEAWEKLVEYLNENDFLDVQLLSGKSDFRVELNEYGNGLAKRTYETIVFEKGNYVKGLSKFFSKEQLYNIYKGLKGVPKGGDDNYRKAVVAKMKSKFGLKDYKAGTETDQKKPFIFIIDEINRGEMSKIFGELFFSIDPDYRGTKGKVRTQYANMLKGSNEFDYALGITTSYGHFFVPENVYIIGTMNDIDRSVDSMDFAMRRRFTFVELKASECLGMLEDLQLSNGISKDDIIAKMDALNSEIEKIPGLSSAYHIGGSYFSKLSKYADKPKDKAYECLWSNHLKPVLTDYLRGLPNLEDKLSSFKTKYDEAGFELAKDSDE